MTEYQILYLRFLQAKRDFPALRHEGHGPQPVPELIYSGISSDMFSGCGNRMEMIRKQEAQVEREFNRST